MFAKAYEIVAEFTHPLIVSRRFFDGSVDCGLGAFVVINNKGWVITAAHMLDTIPLSQQHVNEIARYEQEVATVNSNTSPTSKNRRRHTPHIKTNPKWIVKHSFWWGWDGLRIGDLRVLPDADLALIRLEPFEPRKVKQYPVIKNPANLFPGTSLCKLGFPFHEANTSFDETTGNFTLAPGTLPVPRFPIEGIFTRTIITGKSSDGKFEYALIETSSPGLRGQSGGPVFDINGAVWGIQSRTHHFPLGFQPKIIKGGEEVEENQFLNVGWAVHPNTIVAFLRDAGVDFSISDK